MNTITWIAALVVIGNLIAIGWMMSVMSCAKRHDEMRARAVRNHTEEE